MVDLRWSLRLPSPLLVDGFVLDMPVNRASKSGERLAAAWARTSGCWSRRRVRRRISARSKVGIIRWSTSATAMPHLPSKATARR